MIYLVAKYTTDGLLASRSVVSFLALRLAPSLALRAPDSLIDRALLGRRPHGPPAPTHRMPKEWALSNFRLRLREIKRSEPFQVF